MKPRPPLPDVHDALRTAAPSAPRRRALMLGGLGLLVAVGPVHAQRPADRRIQVGVEGTLDASGLAARLGAALTRDTGLVIEWRAAPGGELLGKLDRGELDAVLVHEPAMEQALLAKNLVHDRRPIAQTELVLVGPPPRKPARRKSASPAVAPGDPAGVVAGDRADVAAALRRIAEAGARGEASFVATGEAGGIRALEQAAWQAAGVAPGAWQRVAGSGPRAVLALAREAQAYALIERGVWSAAPRDASLAVLIEGDPRLSIAYHAMRGFRVSHPAGRLMIEWLAGPRGQRQVAAFGRGYRPGAA